MKRSEMVQVIRKVLLEDCGSPTNADSEEVLVAIEKAGMTPPLHYPYTCGCSMRGQCPACSPQEYKIYNVWEPENE